MVPDEGQINQVDLDCGSESTGSYRQRLASDNYVSLLRIVDRAVFVVSVFIFLRLAYAYWPYLEDDVFIFVRYALQFHAGHGWVMNPGERVNGCTSWLELGIVTLFTRLLTLDQTIEFLKYSGVLCGIGTLYFTRRLVDYCIPSVACIGSLTCLLMVNIHCFALSMVNGLETPMACLFLIAGAYYAAMPDTNIGKRPAYFASTGFLLAALARPETTILFPVLFTVQSVRRRVLKPGPLLLFALPLCLAAAVSVFWYGSALPNTYYAKYATIQQGITEGGGYLLLCLLNRNWLLGLISAIGAAWFLCSKPNKGRSTLLLVSITYVIAILRTHGDWMQDERFAIPLLPFVAASWVNGIALVIYQITRIGKKHTILACAACLPLIYVVVYCVKPAFEPIAHACDAYVRSNASSPPVLWPASGMRPLSMWMCGSEDGRISLANWIKTNVSPGDTVVTTEIGLVTCLNPQIQFIDMLGLTDKTIARLPDYPRSCVGVNSGDDWTDPETAYGQYIEQRKPAFIIFPWSGQPPAARHYALIASPVIYINNTGDRQFLIYRRR